MTTSPPSYEDALKQIENLPESTKETAIKAMSEKVGSEEVQKTLLEEVRALKDSAIAIDNAFERVRLKLIKADGMGYVGKGGKPAEKLAPGWVVLQKSFTTLLWDSRTAATDSVAYINDFVDVIVPMCIGNDASLEDKKEELKVFIDKADPEKSNMNQTHKKAIELSEGFKTLSRDVNAYGMKFDEFAKEQKDAWDADVDRLTSDINGLKVKLAEYEAEILKLGIALGATIVAAGVIGVGVLFALGPFGPIAAALVAFAGLIAAAVEAVYLAKAVENRDNTKAQIAGKEKEIEELQKKLQNLKEAQAELQKCKVDVQEISTRLGGFVSVWSAVAHDARLLVDAVQNGLDAPTNYGLKQRILLAEKGYRTLGEALTEYAKLVDNSGVKKP